MFYKIADIEGFGPDFIHKLESAGITTTQHLLDRARDPKSRSQLAGTTAISESLLTQWVAMADLMRIKGVNRPYADLIIASGIESTEQLVTFMPADVVRRMDDQNRTRKLAPVTPTVAEVEHWIDELRTPEFALVK